jgi:hypothetical protein
MLLEGHVENGQIVLDSAAPLPDGTRVRVETIAASPTEPSPPTDSGKPIDSLQAIKERIARERSNPTPRATLAERYKTFLGSHLDLPADAAANHDFYLLHGFPKPPENPS